MVRRELLFKPGDLFNSTLVNRSRERIFNLGYFKEVNFNMRPGSDETKMNLIIELVEQPTGTVSMGGGYGTITGFSIFTQLGENNLNGSGQQITGRVEFGPIRRYLQISWTEPWFMDKPWSLTLSAFYSSRTLYVGATSITENNNQGIKEVASYERSGVGVSAGLGHRFLINWTHFHRYSPSFFASTRPTSLVSDQVLAEVDRGWQFRSQLTNGIAYDSRDNVFNSTQGFNLIFSVDNVGQFLGEKAILISSAQFWNTIILGSIIHFLDSFAKMPLGAGGWSNNLEHHLYLHLNELRSIKIKIKNESLIYRSKTGCSLEGMNHFAVGFLMINTILMNGRMVLPVGYCLLLKCDFPSNLRYYGLLFSLMRVRCMNKLTAQWGKKRVLQEL